jgi:hypothetical protein
MIAHQPTIFIDAENESLTAAVDFLSQHKQLATSNDMLCLSNMLTDSIVILSNPKNVQLERANDVILSTPKKTLICDLWLIIFCVSLYNLMSAYVLHHEAGLNAPNVDDSTTIELRETLVIQNWTWTTHGISPSIELKRMLPHRPKQYYQLLLCYTSPAMDKFHHRGQNGYLDCLLFAHGNCIDIPPKHDAPFYAKLHKFLSGDIFNVPKHIESCVHLQLINICLAQLATC